jgi:hypothetical protein
MFVAIKTSARSATSAAANPPRSCRSSETLAVRPIDAPRANPEPAEPNHILRSSQSRRHINDDGPRAHPLRPTPNPLFHRGVFKLGPGKNGASSCARAKFIHARTAEHQPWSEGPANTTAPNTREPHLLWSHAFSVRKTVVLCVDSSDRALPHTLVSNCVIGVPIAFKQQLWLCPCCAAPRSAPALGRSSLTIDEHILLCACGAAQPRTTTHRFRRRTI